MKPEQLFKRWQKSLARWNEELACEWRVCRRTGEVEAIHRLRVLLRRLRVCLRPGNNLLGKQNIEAFRQWSIRMSDAVAAARDVDVTLEWLGEKMTNPAVIQALRNRRRRFWQSGRKKLVRVRPVPLLPKRKKRKLAKMAQHFSRKYTRLLEEANREIMAFASPLDTEDTEHWHELRRDLRRIRYLRELALSGKARKRDSLLRELIHLQELLGNAQNCVAAAALLAGKSTCADTQDLRIGLDQDRRRWLAQAQRALRDFQRSRVWKSFDLVKE